MRVLFYIEPVVFRGDPYYLLPHISWALGLLRNLNTNTEIAFVSSKALCGKFSELSDRNNNIYEINSWRILSEFDYQRDLYSLALYSELESDEYKRLNLLQKYLKEINDIFQPDVVVCSSQNTVVKNVFPNASVFFIEQAPLPRVNKKGAMMIDPSGHQKDNLVSMLAKEISNSKLPNSEHVINSAWEKAITPNGWQKGLQSKIIDELTSKSRKRKVVAFALQSNDWITFEGAYRKISSEELIARWVTTLPEGWAGVPFFHPSQSFPLSMLHSLENEFDNLFFLSEELSIGTLDLAIPYLDGFITVSSTSAMTAALSGIPVIAHGMTQYSGMIPPHNGMNISEVDLLSVHDRAAFISFLTHRYCQEKFEIFGQCEGFERFVSRLKQCSNFSDFYFDFSNWDVERVFRLI